MMDKKKEYLQDALGYLDDKFIYEAYAKESMENRKKKAVMAFLKTAAVLVICFGVIRALWMMGFIGIGAPAGDDLKESPKATEASNAAAEDEDPIISFQSFKPDQADGLAPTEAEDGTEGITIPLAEEVFARDTVIFRGTVTSMRYYRTLEEPKEYFTILVVTVSDVYRGGMKKGKNYEVYLPLVAGYPESIQEGNLDQLEIGSEGIFMANKTSKSDTIVLGGQSISRQKLAYYYMTEGEYSLFLEKDGQVLCSDIYGILTEQEPVTLEDAAAYIKSMIRK